MNSLFSNYLRLNRRSCAALLLLTLTACATSPRPESTPPASPSEESATRVVALTSLTADLVATLEGERDSSLVGISGSPLLRDDPRFAGVEVVSEGRVEPDLEKILALEPNLVIGAKGFHDKTLARLTELGIPVLAVDVTDWEAIEALTMDLAERLGADVGPVLTRYENCLAQAGSNSPTTLVLVSRQPLLSPNRDSWAGDFLAQFGFKNLTADLQGDSPFGGYVTLSEEKVLAADPELLLVVETEENLLPQLKGDAFWGKLAATKQGAVDTVDYFGLINPGSLASIETTCEQLGRLGS